MKRRAFPTAHTAVPNLAPMVDVVMVILIFFMLGTSFVLTEGFLSTQLPAQAGPGGAAQISFVPAVRIDLVRGEGDACGIRVMGQPVREGDFSALEAVLRQRVDAGADSQSRVVIRAEPDVRYESVVAAMDSARRAGFARIQFSVARRKSGAADDGAA